MQKTKDNFYQRGESEGWGVLFGLAIIIVIILFFCGFNFGHVNEGYISSSASSDCKQTITLKQGSWETYFGKFICDYIKDDSGKITGGYCDKLVMDKGQCITDYTYDIEPESSN